MREEDIFKQSHQQLSGDALTSLSPDLERALGIVERGGELRQRSAESLRASLAKDARLGRSFLEQVGLDGVGATHVEEPAKMPRVADDALDLAPFLAPVEKLQDRDTAEKKQPVESVVAEVGQAGREVAREALRQGVALGSQALHRARLWFQREMDMPLPRDRQSLSVVTRRDALNQVLGTSSAKVRETAKKVTEELKKPAMVVGQKNVSRREVLGGMLATAAVGQGVASKIQSSFEAKAQVKDLPKPMFDLAPESAAAIEPVEDLDAHELGPKEYDMGALAGMGVGDLFSDYLGLKKGARVPRRLMIDFLKSAQKLWERKATKVKRQKPGWLSNIQHIGEQFTDYYERHPEAREKTTLEDFLAKTDGIIDDVNRSLDWVGLRAAAGETKMRHLKDTDIILIKKLSEKVTGTMLLGYSITELMPALRDSEKNVAVYRFLLENAGPGFLGAIPAVYDVYGSAGLFQFTSFALYDLGGDQRRGASMINQLLPKEKRIDGSVSKVLSPEDQIKAAQLFAVYNIAYFIEDLRARSKSSVADKRIETLTRQLNSDVMGVALLQYIASAHHLPRDARTAFKKWLDKDLKGSHAALASAGIRDYIKKSYASYRELEKVLGAQA